MSAIDVIVGGQFGSESKGRVTLERIRARLAQGSRVYSIRVAGPNAGHVVIDEQGRRWAMRSLPVGFVEPDVQLVIAAGSEIDPSVLLSEIDAVEEAGYEVRNRLYISPEATWLEPRHIRAEEQSDLNQRLGSTAKGIGAARSDRIWRKAKRIGDDTTGLWSMLGNVVDLAQPIREQLWFDGEVAVVIEGTQGYGLGLHAGHYPQCTSSNARAIDFLAMAGLSPWDLADVYRDFQIHLVIRPYPIRVAGNSGELSGETDWEALGLEPEKTTVTQKIRRVGQFDPELVKEAIEANGVLNVRIHVAMVDQMFPELANATELSREFVASEKGDQLRQWLRGVPYYHSIVSLGTGPTTSIPAAAR